MTDTVHKVLLIEDDVRMARLLKHWLTGAGRSEFELAWETTLAGGLKVLSEGWTDAVLLDLGLPDSEGLETVRRVRAADPATPIIVLTAADGDGMGVEAVRNGAQDFLHKRDASAVTLAKVLLFAVARKGADSERLSRLTRVASKLVTPEVIARGAAGPEDLISLSEHLLVTILFADIRGFTTISERLPRADVVRLLNYLLNEMVTSVTEESGYVNKFMGDGLMAIFGAPQTTENDWLHAGRAAFKMQARFDMFNRQRSLIFPEIKGLERDVMLGVGIHSGTAIVGFIGTPDRCEYTAIGDCVNTASRLCSLAAGGEIVVTRIVSDAIGALGRIEDWRLVNLKGKTLTTEIGTLKFVRLG